eukprot:15442584-Alexandrium_andersonii.AAC.1
MGRKHTTANELATRTPTSHPLKPRPLQNTERHTTWARSCYGHGTAGLAIHVHWAEEWDMANRSLSGLFGRRRSVWALSARMSRGLAGKSLGKK